MLESMNINIMELLSWLLKAVLTVKFARYLRYAIFGDEIARKIPTIPRMNFFQFVAKITSPKGPDFIRAMCQKTDYTFRIPGTRWLFGAESLVIGDPLVVRPFLENPKNQQKASRAYVL